MYYLCERESENFYNEIYTYIYTQREAEKQGMCVYICMYAQHMVFIFSLK